MWIRTSSFLKQFYKRTTWNCRFCSSISQETAVPSIEADPAPLFFDKDVQQFLRTLTRVDYERAFRTRKDGRGIIPPKFKFMTDEDLQKAQWLAQKKLDDVLQMPPVVKTQADTVKVLNEDPALEGLNDHKYVFTDISYGICNKDRIIVVRDPDGTLRHANRNERHRMNQVYFPMVGREFHTPKMFYDPYFKDLLEREEYEFILDRACIQFEPDDAEYKKITEEVYFCVNMGKKFDKLRSTRHFGPFAFYLAWEGKIDSLLIDVIQSEKIEEAVSLIQLYHRIHPEAKSAQPVQEGDDLTLIRNYVNLDSLQHNNLQHTLLMYEKLQQEKKEIEENVKKAHGLVDHGPVMEK